MGRGFDRDEEREQGHVTGSLLVPPPSPHRTEARSAGRDRPNQPQSRAPRSPRAILPLPSSGRRSAVGHEGHEYHLRGSESRTLDTLGTFRVVLTRDLVARQYDGDRSHATQDLRSLQHQGLIERRTMAADRAGHSEELVTLTEAGRDLLVAHRGPSQFSPDCDRPVYAGWGKPRELVHDASLYRMFQVEAERIGNEGGTVRRVLLDDELKGDLYAALNRETYTSSDARHARLLELAQERYLPVVDGHVQLPDLRLEYENAGGERGRVDLELATDHYHAGHLGAKQRAGFTIYSAAGSVGRGVHSLSSAGSSGRGGSSFDPHYLSGLLSL